MNFCLSHESQGTINVLTPDSTSGFIDQESPCEHTQKTRPETAEDGLKPSGMAHQEVPGVPAVHPPAGAFATPAAAGSVKPEAADDQENVPVLGINGDPVPGPFLPVIQEQLGMAGGSQEAGFLQDKSPGQ